MRWCDHIVNSCDSRTIGIDRMGMIVNEWHDLDE